MTDLSRGIDMAYSAATAFESAGRKDFAKYLYDALKRINDELMCEADAAEFDKRETTA